MGIVQENLFNNTEGCEKIRIQSFTAHYINNRIHPIQPFEICGLTDDPVEFKFALCSSLFVYLKEKNKIFYGKSMFALSIYKGIKNIDPDWREHFTTKGTIGEENKLFVRGLTDEDIRKLDKLVVKMENRLGIEL